jgi:hypothetical protein
VEQGLLGILDQQGHVGLADFALGLLEDVDDPLVGGSQGRSFGQLLEGQHGLELGHHEIDAGRLEGQHRIHHVLGMAGITQVLRRRSSMKS